MAVLSFIFTPRPVHDAGRHVCMLWMHANMKQRYAATGCKMKIKSYSISIRATIFVMTVLLNLMIGVVTGFRLYRIWTGYEDVPIDTFVLFFLLLVTITFEASTGYHV